MFNRTIESTPEGIRMFMKWTADMSIGAIFTLYGEGIFVIISKRSIIDMAYSHEYEYRDATEPERALFEVMNS
jgi:hypothetical protein